MKDSKKKKLVIILLGPPGSGKGTQAELLSEKLSLYLLETSKVIETKISNAKPGDFEKVRNKKYSLAKEKKFWETGIINTPELVAFWIKEKIKELWKFGENLVLAGSPRTLAEGKEVMPILEKLYGKENIKIILIDISAKESIFRNSHRRICQLMRHPILYSKETKELKICPLDGSKLIRRKGLDEPETIKVRLKQYKERTYPLVKLFKERGLEVKKINGEGTVAEVFQRIRDGYFF